MVSQLDFVDNDGSFFSITKLIGQKGTTGL